LIVGKLQKNGVPLADVDEMDGHLAGNSGQRSVVRLMGCLRRCFSSTCLRRGLADSRCILSAAAGKNNKQERKEKRKDDVALHESHLLSVLKKPINTPTYIRVKLSTSGRVFLSKKPTFSDKQGV